MSNAILLLRLRWLVCRRFNGGSAMLADNLEIRTARKIADLEKRISDLERLVSWLVGLLIDLVAVGLGVAGALFVAGEYYRMSSIEGSVVFAFVITMLAANFIFRKVASWCLD